MALVFNGKIIKPYDRMTDAEREADDVAYVQWRIEELVRIAQFEQEYHEAQRAKTKEQRGTRNAHPHSLLDNMDHR